MADLFTITLSGGTVLRYTSAQVAVTVNALTYAVGPVITRGKTKLAVGVAVDTLDLSISADASVNVNGTPLLQFIAAGGFDGAKLVLERAFSSGPGAAWVGALPLFQGSISGPQTSRYTASMTVNSDSELLNVMVPRNVYQPGCSNTLFDPTCGLAKAAYALAVTATSATDATRTVFSSARGEAAGYFALGWLVGVTGANAGVGRTVKAFAVGTFQAIQPWPAPVAAGDTFTGYPGCDKTQATCTAKFANVARFRGHPYVPAPESIT